MRNLLLKTGRGTFHSVASNDILYIERLKGRTRVYLKDKDLRVNVLFSDLFEQLDDSFIQCHRRYLVNLSYVNKFTNRSIRLEQDIVIPVGKIYKNEFIRKMINNHDHLFIKSK